MTVSATNSQGTTEDFHSAFHCAASLKQECSGSFDWTTQFMYSLQHPVLRSHSRAASTRTKGVFKLVESLSLYRL